MTRSVPTAACDIELDSVASGPDLKHGIRRLGTFARTIDTALDQFNRRYASRLVCSRPALTRTFLDWVRAFEAQRPIADRDRRDFSHFAAGLLMRAMLQNGPVRDTANKASSAEAMAPADVLVARANPIVDFWPEGFFYFEFCITILDAVLSEQGFAGIDLSEETFELRSWESFRENVKSDPDLAIPFFDVFLKGDPNWNFPLFAASRHAIRRRICDD
ncbi:hypothetical protein LQ948_06315 [Jiella sp. MQZ9-1]|uniref:Uncharacterized protein n=1 Tax=Jiella flava TaxID=2816857 RepID=A0A939FVN2_9HYPH|nr:hypothetical protein [Jiella flava]MBO0662352.1 hypothetical protein [Jiella flava]MCD2470819.1 hypothetical protein [Jiella flava]